jgi:HEAT repeat protein
LTDAFPPWTFPARRSEESLRDAWIHIPYASDARVREMLHDIRRQAQALAKRKGPSLDEALVEAMGAVGPQEVIDALADFIKSQPEKVREAAASMLADLGNRPSPAPVV